MKCNHTHPAVLCSTPVYLSILFTVIGNFNHSFINFCALSTAKGMNIIMINIHARVKHLIQKYGTRNPAKIIAYLGINLLYEDLGEETKGFYINLLTNKYIVVNSNLDEDEIRIILAHELGHAMLHYHKSTCYLREYTLFPRGRTENEANKFAAELLINEKELDEFLLSDNICVDQLACYYGVPKKLIEYKFNKYI